MRLERLGSSLLSSLVLTVVFFQPGSTEDEAGEAGIQPHQFFGSDSCILLAKSHWRWGWRGCQWGWDPASSVLWFWLFYSSSKESLKMRLERLPVRLGSSLISSLRLLAAGRGNSRWPAATATEGRTQSEYFFLTFPWFLSYNKDDFLPSTLSSTDWMKVRHVGLF